MGVIHTKVLEIRILPIKLAIPGTKVSKKRDTVLLVVGTADDGE